MAGTVEELQLLKEHRWWSADEIVAAESETFSPRRLGHFYKQLLADSRPRAPIDVGV
jgi:hypothetical protein